MNRLFEGLGRNVVRFRWLVVLAWIIVAVVSTKALPSLGSEINNDNSQFLPNSAPSIVASNLLNPIFGSTTKLSELTVIASRASGHLDAADENALAAEAVRLRQVPHIVSVRLLGVSPDGQAAQFAIEAGVGNQDVTKQKTIVNDIQATFSKAALPSGLSLHLAGPVATNVANQASSDAAGKRTQQLSFIFVVLLLLVIFRSVLAPIVTLVPVGFTLAISLRFIGGLGAHGLKISEITELLLIVLLIGAGTDYGLFLVFRVREELGRGIDQRQAVVDALVRVGESISASGGTVIFALLSLLLASFGVYKDLGVPLAVGVGVMLLAGLTLLPALLAILGRAVFWPSRVGVGADREGWWGRIASRLVARPALTLVIGVTIFGGLAAASFGYRAAGFGGALTAPAGSNEAAGNALLARHFPHASANPANLAFVFPAPVWQDPQVLANAENELVASGKFTQLSGPLDPNGTAISPSTYAALHRRLGLPGALPPVEPASLSVPSAQYNAYRTTTEFVSADGRTVQFEATLRAGDQSSTAAMDATPVIRATVTDVAKSVGAVHSGVAGEAAALYDVNNTSNRDLLTIVPVAILAIGLLLALVLRSLIAPLYLIVSVAFSFFAALGVSTLVFVDIGGASGLTFVLPFLMFIFLLALGEDYNILVMTRIREEAHQYPLREAVVRAVGRTGPTVTSAGLVLAGSFAVLAIAGDSGPGGSQFLDIGFGLALGILMDTFLVRTLLVPSTVALLGRWNWWPARMGRSGDGSDAPPREPELAGVAGKS